MKCQRPNVSVSFWPPSLIGFDKIFLSFMLNNTLDCFFHAGNTDDFFENTISNVNTSVRITCCHTNSTSELTTCGLGESCEGKCSAVGAFLCPSGMCTGDRKDCSYNFVEPSVEPSGSLCVACLPSSAFKQCHPRCPVVLHQECCFHPLCYKKKPQKCAFMSFLTGNDSLKNNGDMLPFQARLVPFLLDYPTVNGLVRYRRFPSLEHPSLMTMPRPTQVSIDIVFSFIILFQLFNVVWSVSLVMLHNGNPLLRVLMGHTHKGVTFS